MEEFRDLYMQDMVHAGKLLRKRRLSGIEMTWFQEVFIKRGLDNVHKEEDQMTVRTDLANRPTEPMLVNNLRYS